MKVLFSKTFIKMFKLIPVVACVIISGFFGFILSNQYLGLMSQKPTYLSLSQDVLCSFSFRFISRNVDLDYLFE